MGRDPREPRTERSRSRSRAGPGAGPGVGMELGRERRGRDGARAGSRTPLLLGGFGNVPPSRAGPAPPTLSDISGRANSLSSGGLRYRPATKTPRVRPGWHRHRHRHRHRQQHAPPPPVPTGTSATSTSGCACPRGPRATTAATTPTAPPGSSACSASASSPCPPGRTERGASGTRSAGPAAAALGSTGSEFANSGWRWPRAATCPPGDSPSASTRCARARPGWCAGPRRPPERRRSSTGRRRSSGGAGSPERSRLYLLPVNIASRPGPAPINPAQRRAEPGCWRWPPPGWLGRGAGDPRRPPRLILAPSPSPEPGRSQLHPQPRAGLSSAVPSPEQPPCPLVSPRVPPCPPSPQQARAGGAGLTEMFITKNQASGASPPRQHTHTHAKEKKINK
ncbi:translation initiation factor IF-2-like [Passer montanus]|uniref:translation initiation factor IF-2-like n=1 Tax=Passer montanus TaxID=9160 RepID=UPI001960B068|nr:translation initiation factor IF-2-like [Passer montanus]